MRHKFLRSKLNVIDQHRSYEIDREIPLHHSFHIDKLNMKNQPKTYKYLELSYLSFFEVIEIDKFDKFRKSLITRFSSKHSGFGKQVRFKDELSEKLSKTKINFDSSGVGGLINLDFNKNDANQSDLINHLTISYIKTNESYFILHFEVKTSEKFNDLTSEIFKSAESNIKSIEYNSIKNIIKHRIFCSYTSFKGSLTRKNIDNLISDLQYQLNYNFLRYIQGYFSNSNFSVKIPKIEHYTAKNFLKHKEKNSLFSFFNHNSNNQFSSKDKLIDVYTNKKERTIYIIKEKGHGKRDNSKSDMTNYDWLESYYLIQSMAFPCVFDSILSEEFLKLNYIKRKMYDFLENNSKWNILKSFSLLHQNNKYLKLKKEITKLNLITNKYKNEFGERSLNFFINRGGNIQEFEFSNDNRRPIKAKNLLQFYFKKFKNEIESLTNKKDDINKVFKNIEELNSYRTNYILQIVSLLIGVLAFIFAFEKMKDIIVTLVNN